ncbi:hypothetical protein [Specibacter sp. NPDC078709]|uniref:hypothetical protein n=1 Tax=Specibacter sp. NPDC078709 TaxID=3154364 RepID=UPI0034383F1F
MTGIDQDPLIYSALRNDLDLNVVFAYKVPVLAKSLVAAFKWLPENASVHADLDLSWSGGLNSYFSYAPGADTAGLRRGPTISLPGPGRLEIRLLNWPAKTPAQIDVISGLFAAKTVSATGTPFIGLQRIRGNGRNS